MDRRDDTRRRYRRALVPGLVLSIVAHALLLGLGGLDVPLRDGDDRADRERAERHREPSLKVVAIRPSEAPPEATASSEASSPVRAPSRSAAASDAPPAGVRSPAAPTFAAEPVPVPTAAPVLGADGRRDERLTATELASLFPGSDQTPRPTSRAARRVSGEHRDVGDRFQGAGGARRVGPRGGSCTANPGTIIDRRLPRDVTAGG